MKPHATDVDIIAVAKVTINTAAYKNGKQNFFLLHFAITKYKILPAYIGVLIEGITKLL